MAGDPYIGRKYRRIPQHPTLPAPYPGRQVGLACPNCPGNDTSLVYSHAGVDTITVKCATVEKHYFRTFKLNQLNHELALINAGATYPVPFDARSHGPPVNIHGEVLPPQPATPKRPKRPPPSIKCARPNHGPTAAKHRVHGNLGCTSHYCKACCAAFGVPGGCYEHRPKGPNRPQPPPASSTPVEHLPPAAASTIPPVGHIPPPPVLPQPKRARGIPPPQCSQSVRRVGRLLPEESLSVLERARYRHSDATRKASNSSFDEAKVVSLHFVNKEIQNPIISHFFASWPVAILDECQSLARQVEEAAGPTWDGNVLVWDEQVRNWREIPMRLPHRYIQTARNLVICVPAHRSLLTNELQDVLEGLGLGKPKIPNLITQTSTQSAEEKEGRPPGQSNTHDRNVKSSQWFGAKSISLDDDSSGEEDQIVQAKTMFAGSNSLPTSPLASQEHQTNIGGSSSPVCIDLTSEGDQPEDDRANSAAGQSADHLDAALLTQVDQKPSLLDLQEWAGKPPATRNSLLEWPGETLLLSHLLDWFNSSGTWGTRIPQWLVHFGNEYEFNEPTAYRYWKWVFKVGYVRFKKWLEEWPQEGDVNQHNLTVDRARRYFQREFNEVSSLKNSVARERGLGVGKGPRPVLMSAASCTASNVLDLDASEDLGWKVLPFDQPSDANTDVVFGLVRQHDEEMTPPDVLDFKWACMNVHVNVNRTNYIYRYDGRTTHHAVMHPGSVDLALNAVALDLRHDTLGHHLRFAQMFLHAACLLKKFKVVLEERASFTSSQEERLNNLRIVQNVVLRKAIAGHGQADSHHWFNLREPILGKPVYITSDDAFTPAHRAKGFIGKVLACFTHWTYDYHGKQALICGFRGFGEVITDLNIMDSSRPWFLNNTYTGGLQAFASTHVCSSLCEDIGLKPPPPFYPVE
ncbi:hypothetical protein DFH28DRAFT_880194 [Melampsora americana]|nr:hypothetical protein DFH28DRAFT_880314 [Melampsora americana]KAH9823250.1 hypothetical protein DFH28DRAFT_880194 [Melampsora americana]